ncbi:hypothetical protein BGZ93_002654, partial [Podila epicladia]
PHIHAALSPIPESPQYLLNEDETTNYSQCTQNYLLHETTESLAGDLFFTTLSPSSCISHIGNDSFIHNPEDGPYTPILFSTPSHTGDNTSDGYKTPSGHGSPHPPRSPSPVLTPKATMHRHADPHMLNLAKPAPTPKFPTQATTIGHTETLPDAHA